MAYENLLIEKEDGYAIMYINRPKALNAINDAVLKEMAQIIDEIDADPEVRVLIITGAGDKSFVAGADIVWMYNMDQPGCRKFSAFGEYVMRKLELMEKPVIAAVNGFALGGGCELAMACDIRLAADNALFAQPEVGLGVIPGFGGTQRLPRLIGEGRAKELTYTCDNIKADEAYRIGLVNHVYPQAELMDQARKMAKKIIRQAPLAVGYAKHAINKGIQCDIDTGMAIEADMFGNCAATQDKAEGMGAFIEKRKPTWQAK
jgi:enoyl-CoA hydratase